MTITDRIEVELYTKDSVELPPIIRDRFPRIQSVFPVESIGDVRRLYAFARKQKMAVVPRGAATSGIGCLIPLKKAVMADLTPLHRILEIDEEGKTATVEAGLRWWELKNALKEHSLDLCTSPTSLFSTVGGWLSTGGYGIGSFRYGHISSLVEAMEIVTPTKSQWLDRSGGEFRYVIGAEGQMGIISKVRLKVRERKTLKSHAVFFDDVSRAVRFVTGLVSSVPDLPVHVSFFDRHRLGHKNLFLPENVFFPRKEGVLVVHEDPCPEDAFLDLVGKSQGTPAESHLSALLWNERYFPFSAQRFYSSLLGSEAVLPLHNLDRYVSRARKLAENCGLSLATEATVINTREAVVLSIFPSDPRRLIHFIHLLLSYSLSRLAGQLGGKPYGIGLWNLPLLRKFLSAQTLESFRLFKKESDPSNLLNPGKSFSSGHSLTRLLKIAHAASPILSSLAPFMKSFLPLTDERFVTEKKKPSPAESCTSCGACVAVCPAYLIDRTETVTAKGKLYLFRTLQAGNPLPSSLAEKIFLCLHCRLCETVCQSKLSLIPVWEKLEAAAENTVRRPAEKINQFIESVESHPAYDRFLDSFGVPINSCQRKRQDV